MKNSGRKFERLSLKDTIFESAKPATAMLTLTTESPKVAEDALWVDPWCTMSPGPVRRAARRSEMQIMFAVREGSRSL